MRLTATTKLFFAVLFVMAPAMVSADISSLAELEDIYGDRACMSCHEKTHSEWSKSLHSRSVVHILGGLKNFINFGLVRDWNKPVNKENLMRCMHCHAPLLEFASEALIKEIGEKIISASGGNESSKKDLGRLSVNCIVCHSTVAAVEVNLRGLPKPGVYYGPTGKNSPAHKTEKSNAVTSSAFCSRCHWLYTPPDGDTLYCNTLYGSYQDAYRTTVGSSSCQDCHMRANGRGHTFPGAYEPDMVREGIDMDIHVSVGVLQPGRDIKTAFIMVNLVNRAGHRIPDG